MSEMDTRGDERPFEDEELSIETPEADAAERHRSLRESDDPGRELPIDVDPADAAEQERTVDLDDDDEYR